ncbi:MAG: sigma-70 family RNA polymerase sigma factor, partial [Nannocystaceae bacterium]
MSDIGVMTPEEELASAVRIVRARQSHWEAILAYPPFIDAIVAVIEAKIDAEDVPTSELKQIRKTSRELRDRETKNHKQAFEAAKDALSEQMRDLDVDGVVSEIVVGDIAKITVGDREDLSLAVNFPRQGSRPFKAYSDSVASTAAALTHAKNRFVKANLRLVVSIARRFNHGRMPLQDLIQEGNLGLLKAVDRFDYRKGFRFSTYGSWWIRHAISRAIADKGRAVRLPVHMIDAQHKLTKAKRELEMVNGREPTTQELSGKTGLTTVKIEKMQGLLLDQAISLDRPVSKDDGRRIVDFLEDEDAEIPGEALEISSLNEQVRQCIMALRPIEA